MSVTMLLKFGTILNNSNLPAFMHAHGIQYGASSPFSNRYCTHVYNLYRKRQYLCYKPDGNKGDVYLNKTAFIRP